MAHFKFTVLVTEKYTEMITGSNQKPNRPDNGSIMEQSRTPTLNPEFEAVLNTHIRVAKEPKAQSSFTNTFQTQAFRPAHKPYPRSPYTLPSTDPAEQAPHMPDCTDTESEDTMDTSY